MGYLQNCTITSYSAEEFAGDSYANETLESQTLPSGTGYTSSEAQALNSYFLKISPLPNYRIDSSMMTMGNLSWYADGEFSVLGTQIRKWETLNPGTLAAFGGTLNQLVAVRVYDTLTDSDTNCNNEIIVQVVFPVDFVMPSNDLLFNIDFGLIAYSCEEEQVWINNAVGQQKFQLIINSNFENCDIFVAKYFDDATYAGSIYQYQNALSSANFYNSYLYLPVYDPDFLWLSNNPEYFVGSPNPQQDSPLASFQPTTYNQYNGAATFPSGDPWIGWFDINTTNNITTDCGQLNVYPPPKAYNGEGDLNSSANIVLTQDTIGPNAESNPIYHDRQYNEQYTFLAWSGTQDNQSDQGFMPFLSQIDYPFLTPGDGVLPTHLQWYISIGDNSDYELIASISDLWKIVTTNYVPYSLAGNADFDEVTYLSQCPSEGGGIETLISETNTSGDVTQNNSYLDIANAEITQVVKPDGSIDRKTIKVKIPFQSNVQIPMWTVSESFGAAAAITKIFLNLYPTEV